MKKLILLLTMVSMTNFYATAQTFTEVTGTPFEEVRNSSIAFADVDGDGDQDVIVTGAADPFQRIAKLYTNDGSGNYTEVTGTPFIGVHQSAIAFADVDGDGDQDLLITGQEDFVDDGLGGFDNVTSSNLYLNDGSGNFSLVTGTPFIGVMSGDVDFADVDGDMDQDLLIMGDLGPTAPVIKLYTNDGSGNFTEVTGTPFDGCMIGDFDFADVDGDMDLDVLITGRNSSYQKIAKLYTNDGSGNFTEVTGTPFEEVEFSAIAFADVDGDMDQDVLITGGCESSNQAITKLYTNDGSGGFTEVMSTPFEEVIRSSIGFSDIDSDGDQDVLITGINQSFQRIAKLYVNDGSGGFTLETGTPFEGVHYSAIAFADVDGDGDEDVLITGESDFSNVTFSPIPSTKLYKNVPLIKLELQSTAATISENSGVLTFRFTRIGINTTISLPIHFSISGTVDNNDFTLSGIPAANVSYTNATNKGSITFPANATTVDLTVTPVNDNLVESTELIEIILEPAP